MRRKLVAAFLMIVAILSLSSVVSAHRGGSVELGSTSTITSLKMR